MSDKPSKILVIEDNPGDTRLIREMFSEMKNTLIDLECVDLLSKGLDRLSEGGIDMVLLDLSLPDSRGIDTFFKVHAQVPRMPVVILSSLDDEKLAVKAVREGAQDYLVKGQVNSNLLSRAIQYAFERKRFEEHLRQSQKMEAVGKLAGGIAHNFNNILASIIGYTEMSIDNIPEDNPARKNLKQVLIASNRARDLVKQILTLSRQKTQELKPVNISHIAEESLKMLCSTIPTTIEIRQNISCPSDVIMGDTEQIQQVLMNLCINAQQSMKDTGGVIEVSLANVEIDINEVDKYLDDIEPGKYVKLTVSDTGHGIDPAIIDRIFEPFFTGRGLATHSGLGLSTSHGIVRTHNGTITLESKPGKGATFHVLFPVIEAKAEPEAATFEPLLTEKGRILFVDDEELLLDIAKQSLERLGYEVTVKTDSLEALETFRNQPDRFDLVITDQIMPHLTGEKLAKELLKIRKDIPIILSTGRDDSITDEKIKSLGIKGFLMKPYEIHNIAKTIRDVLCQFGVRLE